MQTIRDAMGDAWDIRITFGQLAKIKSRTGVTLLPLTDEDRLKTEAAVTDPETLGRIVYALIETQAMARGVSEAQWLEDRWDMPTYASAAIAVHEEVLVFCQSGKEAKEQVRQEMEQVRERLRAAQQSRT